MHAERRPRRWQIVCSNYGVIQLTFLFSGCFTLSRSTMRAWYIFCNISICNIFHTVSSILTTSFKSDKSEFRRPRFISFGLFWCRGENSQHFILQVKVATLIAALRCTNSLAASFRQGIFQHLEHGGVNQPLGVPSLLLFPSLSPSSPSPLSPISPWSRGCCAKVEGITPPPEGCVGNSLSFRCCLPEITTSSLNTPVFFRIRCSCAVTDHG